MHLMGCWIGLVSMHIVTDFDKVRQDYHLNFYCGTLQAYFYVAVTTWTACEAHGTFRYSPFDLYFNCSGHYNLFHLANLQVFVNNL